MELINYLRQNGLEKTCEDLKILHKRHSIYPQLVTMKYDMIESDFSKVEVRQARGIILDASKNWKVVARAYDKFFNFGEGYAAKIDWDSARVLEKLDGSLCLLYWNEYAGTWSVATQGTPDASGAVNGYPMTFADMFWETWDKLGYKLPDDHYYTYIFELMRNENRVVVRHEKPRLVFHGQRSIEDTWSYHEMPYSVLLRVAKSFGWEVVKSFDLTSIDEVIDSCQTINPMDMEGYVVCDENFNRVKVKSPQYLALHSMRDGFGPKRVVEMIRLGDSKEWLSYFPEFQELHDKYKAQYDALISKLANTYNEFKDIKDQKEFALAIKNVPFTGALFMIRAGKINTFKEYLANMNISHLMDYFHDV